MLFLSLALTICPILRGSILAVSASAFESLSLDDFFVNISSGPSKILPLPLALCITSISLPPVPVRTPPVTEAKPVCSNFFARKLVSSGKTPRCDRREYSSGV